MIRKVAFTMLPMTDVARARAFYEETLGLALGSHGSHGEQWWIEYDLPGGGCIALSNFGPAKPGAGGMTLALEVEDLDATMERLAARGVVFHGDVVRGPNCRMVPCSDSEGNSLLLHQIDG